MGFASSLSAGMSKRSGRSSTSLEAALEVKATGFSSNRPLTASPRRLKTSPDRRLCSRPSRSPPHRRSILLSHLLLNIIAISTLFRSRPSLPMTCSRPRDFRRLRPPRSRLTPAPFPLRAFLRAPSRLPLAPPRPGVTATLVGTNQSF